MVTPLFLKNIHTYVRFLNKTRNAIESKVCFPFKPRSAKTTSSNSCTIPHFSRQVGDDKGRQKDRRTQNQTEWQCNAMQCIRSFGQLVIHSFIHSFAIAFPFLNSSILPCHPSTFQLMSAALLILLNWDSRWGFSWVLIEWMNEWMDDANK